jgi:hypothetical protein
MLTQNFQYMQRGFNYTVPNEGKGAISKSEGSLTSVAELVFGADILVKVLHTNPAILDVYFLLVSVSMVSIFSLALIRRLLQTCGISKSR